MNTLQTINKEITIKSEKLTLQKIVSEDLIFNIPIYQRLYVWTDQQIKTLLGDLQNAFIQFPDEKYYLGGIMLSRNNEKFDLIDGQQRFTTLWLLSKILGDDLEKFIYTFRNRIQIPRLSFSVRDFANNYFSSNGHKISLSEEEKEELQPIATGLETIENFIKDEIVDKQNFANFIFKNILFVATEMPKNTDENKVFEAMNNRGVQLQQHEILKSRLLKNIKSSVELRNKYSLLWDACSIMDFYLERNIKNVANLQWKALFPERNEEEFEIADLPEDILNRIGNTSVNEKARLLEILNGDFTDEDKTTLEKISEKTAKEEEYDAGKVRSIVTFPMLLLHTLRIFQFRFKNITNPEISAEVKGKELINIFESYFKYFQTEEDVTNFIDLLWKVRKNFDRFVIKWVSDEEGKEEFHAIKRLYQNKTSFQRRTPKSNEEFALLQSMLYHSQQIITLYWLTPFLNKMLDTSNIQELNSYLKCIDNEMFCNEKQDLRTNSFNVMLKDTSELKGDFSFVMKTLKSNLGTSFPSYWFYKLEFVLWYYKSNFDKEKEWQEYRFTAKNSVEHISPQHPKPEDTNIVYNHSDSDEIIRNKQNDFGNLVLLSPGMNSEYSNKTYNIKRIEFREKKRLDALKSDLIFENESWSWEICEKHRDLMINNFEKYLIETVTN